ncbi:hypothetical protein [Solimicrobium silvestre]|uniref:Uncharacterized protein n=1 Tax=Solimicrobium silvestre TaxID=2099400 RepID=A0A2S9GZQ1_9BURK|nr:hypothetical protein [Solimicrobium silvestre]PRC93178.1 hypothetical protein S2091_2264 [Solimicrobium silvestre]
MELAHSIDVTEKINAIRRAKALAEIEWPMSILTQVIGLFFMIAIPIICVWASIASKVALPWYSSIFLMLPAIIFIAGMLMITQRRQEALTELVKQERKK